MEMTESVRFRLVQFYLRVPEDRRPPWPVFAESWDWFRLRDRRLMVRHARHLTWLVPEDRQDELLVYLIPHLVDLKYDASRGSLDACMDVLVPRAASDAGRAAKKRVLEPSTDKLPADLCSPHAGPEAGLDEQELCCAVHGSIDALPPEDARLVKRHWFDGVSLASIAAEQGRSSAQVRFQHGQACAKLRAVLLHGPWRDLVRDSAGGRGPSGKT